MISDERDSAQPMPKVNMISASAFLKKSSCSGNRLRELFLKYPYHRCGAYGINREAFLEALWRDAAGAGNSFLITDGGVSGGPAGIAVLVPSAWDSAYFGKDIKEIRYLITASPELDGYPAARSLVKRAVSWCRNVNTDLLTARIDVNDAPAIYALSSCGFALADIIVTFVYRRGSRLRRKFRSLYRVRHASHSDSAFLETLAEKAFSKDRFHRDRRLNASAGGLFRNWIADACRKTSSGSECVLVACRNDGRQAGFLSYALDKECLSACGSRIIGRGLSAVTPDAAGAYVSLVNKILELTDEKYDIAEFSTQITNTEPVRIWQKMGLEFAGAKHTFHKWI